MVGFFFYLFSYSGLRAFFTSDFTNCTTDHAHPPKLPQPSGAVHSIWWLGFFFDLFSYSGLRAFFTSDFTNCTTDYASPQITPTIRCCSQHMMVWVFFWPLLLFWTKSIFYKLFTNCTTDYVPPQITPTIRCCSQHLMVGVFFFDLFSYSGLRAFFTSDFTNCTTDYAPPQIMPTIRCCSQHLMVGFFFLISSPILDLEYFSQVIYELYYRLCPLPKLLEPSGAVHSIWWLGFFFYLFSYSGLRAFFTSDFTNCTTDYAPSQNYPNHQVLFTASDGWGFFFLTSSPILDLEHFSQVI